VDRLARTSAFFRRSETVINDAGISAIRLVVHSYSLQEELVRVFRVKGRLVFHGMVTLLRIAFDLETFGFAIFIAVRQVRLSSLVVMRTRCMNTARFAMSVGFIVL